MCMGSIPGWQTTLQHSGSFTSCPRLPQDEFAIAVYEEVVRFHVMCEHELCGEDQSGK